MFEKASLHDLEDFRFGHAQDEQRGTGCTVIIASEGAVCGVDVSGGGPATRETDLLRPENMVQAVHAVVLSGGSAFGLEASCGVMDALAERSMGFSLMGNHVPLVTGACLFDLTVGDPGHPDKKMGRQAVDEAFSGAPFGEGNVGAGTGASVGKILGHEHSMKSGFGYHLLRKDDLIVGAFVATNAVGNISDPQGGWLAGCLNDKNEIVDSVEAFSSMIGAHAPLSAPTNTTIGAIVCNAKLDKAQAAKVSSVVNDAYARVIKPVHTSNDGDAIFTFASSRIEVTVDLVALMATEAMEEAIRRSVLTAENAYGLIASKNLPSLVKE